MPNRKAGHCHFNIACNLDLARKASRRGRQAWQEKQTNALHAAKDHIEEFLDPSTLSDDYLSGVQDRIFKVQYPARTIYIKMN